MPPATRLFAQDGVRAYNILVDDLRAEYDERKSEIVGSDCGVAEVTYPDGASDSECARLDQARAGDVDAAREERVAELVSELQDRQSEHKEDPLDAEADLAASRLDKGPTEENLQELFAAGVLPSGTVDAFTKITFTYDEVPYDLAGMSQSDWENYLKDHPDASELVDKLLTKDDLSADEMIMVKAQANVDADLLAEVLDAEPGNDVLDDISAATARLGLINDHLADGGEYTVAAEQYASIWIDRVGADNLTELGDQVTSSLEVSRHGAIVDDSAVQAYLSPVGDAILNLSNPDNYADDRDITLNDMPSTVQELVELRVGEAQNGYRAGYIGESDMPMMDKVKNLDAFNGWCDLMASSTVTGGDDFSVDLGEQAIQAKQDMNAILVKAGNDTSYQSMTEEEWNKLNDSLTDDGSSDLLTVVSRNEDASAELLVDDTHRQELLGMNWDDGEGAGDVIRAGTDRDPDHGGGTDLQAEAALEVMTEIASDPSEYMNRATNEDISDAIVDVGITWIDTFGENVNSDTESKFNVDDTDVLGREMPLSVTLSNGDQEAFLEFIASTGDEDAIRLEAASQYYGQQLIAGALDQGDPDVLDDALEWAGRADGQIQQANLEWAFDQMEGEHAHDRAELLAQNRSMAAANTASKLILSIGGTIGGAAFPPASPFISVGNAAAGPVIDGLLAQEPIPDYQSMEFEEVQEQLEEAALDSTSQRNLLLAQAAVMKGYAGDADLFDDDGSLKTLSEIANESGNGNGLDKLEALAESAMRDWNANHDAGDQVDIDQYDSARDDTFSNARADDDRKNDDSWRSDHIAEKNLYGDNVPDNYEDDPNEGTLREAFPDQNDEIGKNSWD
ncbi:MAG TPA: hypothetical protein VEX15_15595 [Nocardioidaceae bacterium]|nr:hypothetical protein [Nocardioidaceae bacterium]